MCVNYSKKKPSKNNTQPCWTNNDFKNLTRNHMAYKCSTNNKHIKINKKRQEIGRRPITCSSRDLPRSKVIKLKTTRSKLSLGARLLINLNCLIQRIKYIKQLLHESCLQISSSTEHKETLCL